MAYTTAEGREKLLDDFASAIEQIAVALACLSEAYEHLDDHTAETLEEALFRPVQLAYGRAQRSHTEFARRSGFPVRAFAAASPGLQSQSVQDLIAKAVDAAGQADQAIAELQDSMLPVEVGDPEVRAGLSQVRELLDGVPLRARELVRTVGR
jgi:hypothetical protein